jgi:hypothetical protein
MKFIVQKLMSLLYLSLSFLSSKNVKIFYELIQIIIYFQKFFHDLSYIFDHIFYLMINFISHLKSHLESQLMSNLESMARYRLKKILKY